MLQLAVASAAPPVLKLGCHVDSVLTDWANLRRAPQNRPGHTNRAYGASSAGTGDFLSMRQTREDVNRAR